MLPESIVANFSKCFVGHLQLSGFLCDTVLWLALVASTSFGSELAWSCKFKYSTDQLHLLLDVKRVHIKVGVAKHSQVLWPCPLRATDLLTLQS